MFKREYIPKGQEDIVYSTTISWRNYKPTIINLAIYAYIIGLWIYDIKAYYNFGKYILCPAVAIMFGVAFVVGLLLPSQRNEIAKSVKKFTAGYVTIIFLYKFVISAVAGVSAENFSAAFNQSLPATTGTTIVGWLQTLLWIAAVLGPIKEVTAICQRIGQFYGTKAKNKAIREARDFRETKRPY
ncbi:MAG: hypothetical protein K6F27_10895 [Ruminococcus sp.]|nr:hypothetical protein [Ruminococcus sp.]